MILKVSHVRGLLCASDTVYLDLILPGGSPTPTVVLCTVWKTYSDCRGFHGSPTQPTPRGTTCSQAPAHAALCLPHLEEYHSALSHTAFGASVLSESTVVVSGTEQERMMLIFRCATRPAKSTERNRAPYRASCKCCSASKCDTLQQRRFCAVVNPRATVVCAARSSNVDGCFPRRLKPLLTTRNAAAGC